MESLIINNNNMKKVYYAHSMHLYNTPQEQRDVMLLQDLGYEVLNPNNPDYQTAIKERVKQDPENYMNFFNELIANCDLLAFRCHVDGKIPAGVGKEINFALERDLPVIELPLLSKSRFLDVEETRYYLQLNGQR